MADSYIRKFSPNRRHYIAAALFLAALVLFAVGIHRAVRTMWRIDPRGLTFEGSVSENDSVLLSADPLRGALKGAETETEICYKTYLGFTTDINCYIIAINGTYCPVAVVRGSQEEADLFAGEYVTGYFTYKYSDGFAKYMDNITQVWELDPYHDYSQYDELGIRLVNVKRERISFLWGIPFLFLGLIFLKKAGTPYFYYPKDKGSVS